MKILGFDLGLSSVGWAVVEANAGNESSNKIIDAGVRIFTKGAIPKDGSSLAKPRREARSRRRNLRRKRGRLKAVKDLLIQYLKLREIDLFETEDDQVKTIYREKDKKDIWLLRQEVLTRKLSAKELGRILTHIAKRRGYFPNSKKESLKEESDEKKKVISSLKKTEKEMKNFTTIGEFFFQKRLARKAKGNFVKVRNTANDYSNSVLRKWLQEEIQIIFQTQRKLGMKLPDEFQKKYEKIAFYQRSIKNIKEMVGFCPFEKEEKRAPKQSYSSELFVIVSALLKTILVEKIPGKIEKEFPLFKQSTLEEILQLFHKQKKVKYSTLRKKLKLPQNVFFKAINYQIDSEKKKLPAYQKLLKEEFFLTRKNQEKIFYISPKEKSPMLHTYLRTYADLRKHLELENGIKFQGLKNEYKKNPEEKELPSLTGYHEIKNALRRKTFEKLFADKRQFDNLAAILTYYKDIKQTEEKLENLLKQFNFNSNEKNDCLQKLKNIRFSNFNHLSLKAINALLPFMKNGQSYNEAVKLVYPNSSQSQSALKTYLRPLSKKENYQVTSPIFKRNFSQFRKVLNALVRKYNSPDAIHIRLNQDLKNSKKKRDDIQRGKNEFRQIKKALRYKLLDSFNLPSTNQQLVKMQLYDMQNGICLYSGEVIDYNRAFQDDSYTEIDHILPISRSFDDSFNNKILALTTFIHNKKNQTPFEWIANRNEENLKWCKFKQRINSMSLPGLKKKNLLNITLNKKSRDTLAENELENENSFLAKKINDTCFFSKFVKNFIENNLAFQKRFKIKKRVKVTSSALINQLKQAWKISEKNQFNHLRYAENAIIVAFSTNNQLKKFSTIHARFLDDSKKSELKITPPFAQEEFEKKIKKIFVSFSPNRKATGAAHKDTFYSGSNSEKRRYKSRSFDKKKISSKILEGVSRLYPIRLNQGKTLAKKATMVRIDVFQHEKTKKYYLVPIYVGDFIKAKLPNRAIVPGKDKQGNKKEWILMDYNYNFVCCFYKKDAIKVIKKNGIEIFGYYNGVNSSTGNISIRNPIGKSKNNIRNRKGEDTGLLVEGLGIQNAKVIEKYEVSFLGEISKVHLPEMRVGTKSQLKAIKASVQTVK